MSDKPVAVGSDERREIARKLRAAAVYLPNDIDSDDLEMAIATTVCDYDVPNVETLLNRLADLIEPEPERTCRDTSPLVYKFTCSECHSSYRFGCEHGVWYCPFCGAKVVGND